MIKCPFCNSEVKVKVMTQNIDGDDNAYAHINLCNKCKKEFLTVELYMPKELVEQKILERQQRQYSVPPYIDMVLM